LRYDRIVCDPVRTLSSELDPKFDVGLVERTDASCGGVNVRVAGGGGAITLKSVALVAVPAGVVTRILPVVAPAGTVAWICVAETTVKLEAARLNVTALAPVKLLPATATTVPAAPLVGVNEAIAGPGGGGGGGGEPWIISESGRFQTPTPVVPAMSVVPSVLVASW
jgi:hypothetical protein